MKIGNIVSAIVCIAIGILFLNLSQEFPNKVSNAPGPGFYPSILCWILIILGVTLLIQSLVSKKNREIEISLKSKQAMFVYKLMSISIVYVILLPFTGFRITTFLFLIVMSYVMGLKNYKMLIIIPLAMTILIVLIFETVFRIPLPGQSIF